MGKIVQKRFFGKKTSLSFKLKKKLLNWVFSFILMSTKAKKRNLSRQNVSDKKVLEPDGVQPTSLLRTMPELGLREKGNNIIR